MILWLFLLFLILFPKYEFEEAQNDQTLTDSSNQTQFSEGIYKISDDMYCSLLKCQCCPARGSFVRVDLIGERQTTKIFMLEGEKSGIFCFSDFKTRIIFDRDSQFFDKADLFESQYQITQENGIIVFNNQQNQNCNFALQKQEEISTEYDLEVRINTLSELESGWRVDFNNQSDYDLKKRTETIAVGVIGMVNSGKTWFVNELSESKFKTGFHLHTSGLSVKYDERKKNTIMILDTAGFQRPINFFNENLKDDKSQEVNQTRQKYNDNDSFGTFELRKTSFIKERQITEEIIQNFVMETCDVVFILVGHLTFEDQRMIYKIIDPYTIKDRHVFVIHNYNKFSFINQVFEEIDKDIMGAFKVQKKGLWPNERNSEAEYPFLFVQTDFPNVRHIILAKQGTMAGDYFNIPALKFLNGFFQTIHPLVRFDMLQLLEKSVTNIFSLITKKENKLFIENLSGYSKLRSLEPIVINLDEISFDAEGQLEVPAPYEMYTEYDMIISDKMVTFEIDIPSFGRPSESPRKIEARWEIFGKICFYIDIFLSEGPFYPDQYAIVRNRMKKHLRIHPPCIRNIFSLSNKFDYSFQDGVLTLKYNYTNIL